MNPLRLLRRRAARLTILTVTVAALIVGAGFAGYGVRGSGGTNGMAMSGNAAAAGTGVQPAPANLAPLPQPQVAPPVGTRGPELVKYNLEIKEVVAQLDDGVAYHYWTFNGTVPGPMLRVRVGDTVQITLTNPSTSSVTHSIDLHAVSGPGGGATDMQVTPGHSATFQFVAEHPGAYVYHCATPPPAMHIANGMYGMIVVEPAGGLPQVDQEFYVMQGDMYIDGTAGQPGLHDMSMTKMAAETPDYVVFNGSVNSLTGANALQAKTGQTVRIFFGDGGPNLTSSFHVIGQIFTRVAPDGAIADADQPSEWLTNVQTTTVPPGAATVVELKPDVPGNYTLVDHALSRAMKGASATLHVGGDQLDPNSFKVIQMGDGGSGGH